MITVNYAGIKSLAYRPLFHNRRWHMLHMSSARSLKDFTARYAPALLIGALIIGISIYGYNATNSIPYLMFGLFAAIVGVGLTAMYRNDLFSSTKKPSLAFASVLTFLSLVYIFAFPPLSVPDEPHHFYSSYWIADLITGQVHEQGFDVRTADWEQLSKSTSVLVNTENYRRVLDNFELFQADDSTITIDAYTYDLGSENLPTKIPTVLAILIGRTLHLGTYPLFYLGRIFNAVCFVTCAALAYRITPFGKNAVVALSLLPMTLHLTASFSYDVGIISLGLLLTALVLKAMTSAETISRKHSLSIIVIAAMLAPCKVIYSTIILLALFIPSTKFPSKRSSLLFKAGVVIVPILMILILRIPSISAVANTAQDLDVRGAETGHFYGLSFVLHNPLATAAIFARSFLEKGDFYWSTALGKSLGWFQGNIAVPYFFCIPLLLIFIRAAQRDSIDSYVLSKKMRFVFLAIAGLSFLGCMFTMFIGYTFDTQTTIEGVQGRYILPVAMLLILSLRSEHFRSDSDSFPFTLLSMALMNIVFLLHIVAGALAV